MGKKLKTNSIFRGDCKDIMKQLPKESVDLIYIDPPFFSNRIHEIIWGNGYELKAFEDRWKGGIMNYIDWLKERVEPSYDVLKETGSLFLHCDWRADYKIRNYILDDIFGSEKFLNEIIWKYSVGGRSPKYFPRKHNTIFWYAKGKTWTFNKDAVSIPRKTGYESFGGRIIEEDGKKYQIKVAKSGKEYKYRLDKGKTPEDVWEIQSIQSQSKERLGYPTQKPELLLERIIKAASNEKDVVFDPMCGGGTTPAVAYNLNRKFIGIDVSPIACQVTKKRLEDIGAPITVYNMPTTVKELKEMDPYKFQDWVVERYSGRVNTKKSGDKGIDGYTNDGVPMQVKRSYGVGRNVVDNFETAIRRKRKKKGVIVGFSFTETKGGAYEEVKRAKLEEGLEIKLVTVKELLNKFLNNDFE
ncbi:hypothetical protein GF374_02040 [Candidatus Woesearchaeota archaeon]|nr:hypothetical protein [Candidatus Woesearchaeota archaeon]